MFKQLNIFKVLVIVCGVVISTQYDYELTRGRKMWAGMYNAIHYFDSFTFLSRFMKNIQGVFTTYFPLTLGKEWSLNFQIRVKGPFKEEGDGFAFILTEDPPGPKDLNDKSEPNTKFVDMFPKKTGLSVYFNPVESKLYAGYNINEKGEGNSLSCNLDMTKKKFFIFIKGQEDRVVVSYHYEGDHDYDKCVELVKPENSLKQAFPVIYARSGVNSLFQINLTSMTLSSHSENIGISEFEAKYDQSVPKLFKKISFLKKNQEYLKSQEKPIIAENLNIENIYDSQRQVQSMIEYSNSQISQSLEESDVILSYIDQQKYSSEQFGHNVIDTIQSWLTSSKNNYDNMDSDVNNMITEIKQYDFEGLAQKTEKLLNQLDSKLKDNENEFTKFKKFASLINDNLKELQSRKDLSSDFENNLKEFFLKNQGHDKNLNDVFVLLLTILGLVIIVVLLMILWRLNKSIKKEIF
jgi:hypothetical protein